MTTASDLMALVESAADEVFTFPGYFSTNWESIGGWSLFISLCIFIVIGAFREWWVPGARHRRVEVSAADQSKALYNALDAVKELQRANEIVNHFFEKTVPKRGEPTE